LGCGLKEAKEWAQDFLGEAKDIKMPSQFTFKKSFQEKDSSWISLKPEPNVPAPSLEKLAPKLSQFYQETARHAYKDAEGQLLFYVLRLVHKEDPKKKDIRPLSYGTYKEGEQKPQWALKGYQMEKRPLYHLEQLNQNPKARILIVEGEKTTEAAAKLFAKENIICVTWSGGASAVSKTDWTLLYNKEIVIWPDNDEAGYKAAEEICTELRKVGVKSLGVVDKEILKREFPAKWDLADPQPKNQETHFLKTLILSSNNKAVGLDQLTRDLKHIQKIEEKDLLVAKLQAKEILWRVEERMRSELEKKFGGKHWEINQEILKETLQIFNRKVTIEKQLQSNSGITGEMKHKLAYQVMLHEALIGKQPSTIKIEEMKQAMTNTKAILSPNKETMKEWQGYIENKAWTAVFESRLYTKDTQRNMTQFFQRESQEASRQFMQVVKQEQIVQTEVQQHRSRGIDLSL
jgi:DNA primase